VILTYSLVYPAFTTCVRYRVPIDAFFMLFAAVALVWAWKRLGARLGRTARGPDGREQ
jgi:hypothetical protein